jgi:hypothetical protein
MIENNTYRNEQGNTNLFFHPWLFSNFQVKNVLIGIFHPHGSIYAVQNTPYLNNLIQIEQNYHAPQHFSPNNSHIYIDRQNLGYGIIVCIDQHRLGPIARIELLIYSPTDLFSILKPINDKIDTKDMTSNELMNELSKIEQFNFIQEIFTNIDNEDGKALTPEFNFPAHASRGLFMFDYTGNSYTYNKLLHVNLDIKSENIKWIEEIKNKIPEGIRNLINFEFGLQIINYKN